MKYLTMFLLLLISAAAYGGETKYIKIGDAVPAFTLKNYDGKEVDLQKVLKESKLTVVMFISTQCPVSNAYNDRMVKLAQEFGKQGIAFIGVNSNKAEGVTEIASHAKEKGFPFAVVKDEGNKIADAYGAQVTPEVYVVNAQGKLEYHGRIDNNRNADKADSRDLATALTTLLAGKSPTLTQPKAFGCTIKRINASM